MDNSISATISTLNPPANSIKLMPSIPSHENNLKIMKWCTTFTAFNRIDLSQKYFFLASASLDWFDATTVLVLDLSKNDMFVNIEVPLTPVIWSSMAKDCAGNDLILAGAAEMHHTWRNRTLISHPLPRQGHASKNIWRASDHVAYYCVGRDAVIVLRDGSTDIESLGVTDRLGCIHGLHTEFRVAGGDKGVLFVNRGQSWQRVATPTASHIVDIHCVNENEIYICAGYGGVFRWNGGSDWFHYDVDASAFMYSLCQYRGRMCVASLHLKSYWLDKFAAVPIPESKVATRFKIDGEVLCGLGLGKFEIFDGTNWRIYELDLYKLFPDELEAMYDATPGP